MNNKELVIQNHISKIEKWVEQGGPEESEWEEFNRWIDALFQDKDKYSFNDKDIKLIQNAFGDSMMKDTIQSHILLKPYGYAGDYEIIDKIYQCSICSCNSNIKWDCFSQNNFATKAVRNRKEYFKNLLISKCNSNSLVEFSVLNIASGPCRDIKEIFDIYPEYNIQFDCIEQDINTIEYAKNILDGRHSKINFINKNAVKFDTAKK